MYATALLVLSVSVSAPQLKDKTPKEPPILGEWVRVGHTQAGQPVSTAREDHHQIFTPEGAWEYYYGGNKGNPQRWSFATDARQSPATIDIYQGKPGADGWRGIFKVEADTLTLCLVNTPGERPKTFESSADQPTTVWIFKRVTAKD
jgi:uncharacterized protein (TIGR03067 family)